MHTLPVETIRGSDLARFAPVPRLEVAYVEDRFIPGPREDLMVRIYRPDMVAGRPVIVFFHGSGFVICSVETRDRRMEQWGFRTPKGRTHPISHPTLISHIAWNRIAGKPGIDRVEGRTVHSVDGTAAEVDAIIAARGYETDLPFLPDGASPVRGTHMHLYNRIVHPDMPGLFCVGFLDVTGGSNIRMMDDQSEYVAAVASGAIRLPSREQMHAAIAEDLDFQKRQFPDSPRYGLELDPVRYRKLLARDFARNGAKRVAGSAPGAPPAAPNEVRA